MTAPDENPESERLPERLARLEERTAHLEAQLAETRADHSAERRADERSGQAAEPPTLESEVTEVLPGPASEPTPLDAARTPPQGLPVAPNRPAAPGMRAPRSGKAAAPSEVFWSLLGLRERLDQEPETEGGAVMLTGTLWLPGGDYVERQQLTGTDALLARDWSDLAPSFSALAHPVRLELVRHVLSGTRTTAALQEAGGLTSSGQLHHHLRPLLAAGWLHQAERGSYEVPPERIVPLLALLAAAAG